MEVLSSNRMTVCFFLNTTDNILDTRYKPWRKNNFLVMFLVYLTPLLILTLRKWKINKISWNSLFKPLVSVTLALIALPAMFAALLAFALYRQIIGLVLKLKLGGKFGGFLEGNDAVWAIESPSARSIINILVMVESKLGPEDFYEAARKSVGEIISRNSKSFDKLLKTLNRCFGYYYLINNGATIDDCIGVLELNSPEEDYLLRRLSKYANAALPKEHKVLWQLLIGNRRVRWKNKNLNKETLYPVLFRTHHGLADGASLIKLLTEKFAHTKDLVVKPHFRNTNESKFQIPKLCFKDIYTLLRAPIGILSQSLRCIDPHDLHEKHLSGEKILVLNVEDSSGALQVAKDSKNLPATFSEVLFAAVARSFWSYFNKNNMEVPEFMIAVIPTFHKLAEDFNLKNAFSVATIKLPINAANGPFERLLGVIQSETKVLNNSGIYKVNYWLMKIVSLLLPEPLLRPLLESSQSTLVISNLPGPRAVKMFDNCSVHDIVFWVPHKNLTGIGISVFSYDGRLQIGLNVDRALISDRVQAQEIVDGIYKYLGR